MDRSLTNELTNKIGQTVLLKGWVHARRDHGKLIFLDLRDRAGLAQVVIIPKSSSYEVAQTLRNEFVVEIEGQVNARPAGMINENIPSGKVEILAEKISILNPAKTPPFELDETHDVTEDVRLKYRYLDLRSARMANNIKTRHKIVSFVRNWLNNQDFTEIETPYLTKGTPEGAREFIIPSRLHEGKFYVLPQSPQQFKQLLMVAGFERYYQIARAFRDEDQRGDRQSEHTQFDLEMSFVSQNDVLNLVESLFTELVEKLFPEKKFAQKPWPRLTYDESIKKYGTDKPDLRKDKNDSNELAFGFVYDFPMFELDAKGDLTTAHHPFTMPHEADLDLMEKDPLKVRAYSYDMVLNGNEMASGSIRIHRADIQKKVFEILKLSPNDIEARFGHMLEAFEYGTPPHGGMAPGVDRLTMILCNEPNIREVMAFPKTGDARDLMMGAPSELSGKQLKEAGLELSKLAKSKE